MKNLILLLYVIISARICVFAQPNICTDELLELSGIVWRLADAEEYKNSNLIESYANDVNKNFSRYKSHPLIPYIQSLRQKPHEIGYDGVATSTMLLKLVDGRIKLKPHVDIERYFCEFDSRWDSPSLEKYISLLNDFYRSAKFHKFYENHQSIYKHAIEKLDSLLKPLDTHWFESFFGKPFGNPDVYICLSYGSNNYALSSSFMQLQGEPNYGIIIGCCLTDEVGMPNFGMPDFGAILHEFSHNFANPIVESYLDRMTCAGNKIFPYVKSRLAKIGYGTADSMLGEGLNELFRMMYYFEKFNTFPIYELRYDENGGFIWMQRAIRFMENYYACRKIYPTIEDFMPELVEFMNSTAENIETILYEFEHRHPYVINIFPLQQTEVPVELPAIRIQFSQPMHTGITGTSGFNDPNYENLPVKQMYWSDPTTYVIELEENLRSNASYGIIIPQDICVSSQSGQSIQNDITITFKTIQQ